MAVTVRAALAVATPLAVAALCLLLAFRHIAPGVDLTAMARGIVGPATWPKAMLLAAAAAALLAALVRLLRPAPSGPSEAAEDGDYHEPRSIGAITLVVAYGVSIPLAGIAWSIVLA